MSGTTIQQGYFTSDAKSKVIKLNGGADWLKLWNYTVADGATSGSSSEFYWQYGMGTSCLKYYHPAADQTLAVDSLADALDYIEGSYAGGSWTAITAGTNATQPVYDTGDTTNLQTGSIVRIKSTDQTNINGHDFSIDTINANTDFRLANALQQAPGVVAGASGLYKEIAPSIDVYNMFTPARREITNITQAASAVVTTMVDHSFAVGQRVRFRIPNKCAMTELNGLIGTVTAIATTTITVDINSTGFTAFYFPIYSDMPEDFATVVPFDESGLYPDSYDSALVNQSFYGFILRPGVTKPAGDTSDVIYWQAGVSSEKRTS